MTDAPKREITISVSEATYARLVGLLAKVGDPPTPENISDMATSALVSALSKMTHVGPAHSTEATMEVERVDLEDIDLSKFFGPTSHSFGVLANGPSRRERRRKR